MDFPTDPRPCRITDTFPLLFVAPHPPSCYHKADSLALLTRVHPEKEATFVYEHYENYDRYIPDVMLKKHRKHEEYLSDKYKA